MATPVYHPSGAWDIDLFRLLRYAGIVIGAIIVLLLVLYCLAILIVTKQ